MAWWRWTFLFCGLWLAVVAQAKIPGEFGDRLETNRYDCTLELLPAKTLTNSAAVRVLLEAVSAKTGVSVTITRAAITVSLTKSNGRKTQVAKVDDPGVTPGAPCTLTIMRREGTLGLLRDNLLLFRGALAPGPGTLAAVTMDNGWTAVSAPRIQRLEPVHFDDDFMRAADEPGQQWTPGGGSWVLATAWDHIAIGNGNAFNNAKNGYSQNPFSLVGSAKTGAAVTCTGEAFWEDYTFSVAVQPEQQTAAGVLVNVDKEHATSLLVRWTPVVSPADPGRLTLQRYENGRAGAILASSAGGFIPKQWYQVAVVSSLAGVTVLVDGVTRIALPNLLPWRGGIGLYAEGANGVQFDDVKVYGRTFDQDLLAEIQQTNIGNRFKHDANKLMDVWANPQNRWFPDASTAGLYWYGRDIFGEEWMALSVKPKAAVAGELWMTLNGDGKTPTAGLRAVTTVSQNPATATCTLYRDDRVLATTTLDTPPAPDADYTFRFRHRGGTLELELDGEIVAKADNVPSPPGLRPAFRATGCFADVREPIALSRQMLDYTFGNAPADWLADGAWEPTIRWSCSPNWSFLGGWSRGDAVLWHKARFTGDQILEAVLGAKMEYPRQRETYGGHYHDFNLTICGDGHNPRSGYTGIFLTADRKIALYRNGEEKASLALPADCIPNSGANHRSWMTPSLSKRGNTVTFTVNFTWLPEKDAAGNVTGFRTLSVSFPDDRPIAGGVPAIWTSNNGIILARAHLDFAAPSVPRSEPLLALAQPWTPEWASVGEPVTIELPEINTGGVTPVSLTVTPRVAPPADSDALRAEGRRLTFTPQQADKGVMDEHWYEIRATAGDLVSPAVHLDVHVFDAKAHKRDDSRAQVLYRFTEGSGETVRDLSGRTPAADLKIATATLKNGDRALTAQWLPGQGLTMLPTSRVATEGAAGMDRVLQAIKQSNACTVELWTSLDTVYPPWSKDYGVYTSVMLSWDLPGAAKDTRRNLSLVQFGAHLEIALRDVVISKDLPHVLNSILRTGLVHLAISWDGTTTTCYRNGEKLIPVTIPWSPEKMLPGAPLILGNSADNAYPFFGTCYFLAIHDRAFTPEEARQHYLAGPGGK